MTASHGFFARQMLAVGALAALLACDGGGNGGPTGPGPGGGAPGPSGATITIGSGGVSPATVTVAVGQSVTFTNSSGGTRNATSDPHPLHTDCPQINAVGNLANGQSRLTHAFPTSRSCGFHDHNDPDNPSRRGTIVIQ